MDYFDAKISLEKAIVYGIVIIGSLTLCSLIDHTFFWNSARYGIQIKTAISGLLYNKVIITFVVTIDRLCYFI
jgi:hypothetical protein